MSAAISVSAVHAQDAPPSAPAGARDPGDPKVMVPPANYKSAFRRYRPNAEVEVGGWRDLNNQVGRIGGWRVYGREALPEPAPEKATSAKPSDATAPAHGHRQ